MDRFSSSAFFETSSTKLLASSDDISPRATISSANCLSFSALNAAAPRLNASDFLSKSITFKAESPFHWSYELRVTGCVRANKDHTGRDLKTRQIWNS